MGFADFFKTASKTAQPAAVTAKAKPDQAGELGFQTTGTAPQTDKSGRVIVKLKAGSEVILPVHTYKMALETGTKLAGKPKQDEEFDKSVKTRVSLVSQLKGSEEVLVETVDGDPIGFVKRESAQFAATLFSQIQGSLTASVKELSGRSFVFEVSANIIGEWSEDQDENGKDFIYAEFAELNLKIKAPISAEVD
jgi:hypothetical protein